MKAVAVALLALAAPVAAPAQSGTSPDQKPQDDPPSNSSVEPGTNASTGSVQAGTMSAPRTMDYAKLEALRPKGWDIPFPRVEDTILQDSGGVRSALADAGIGVLGLSANTGVYNLRHDNTPGATYNGRRPTY